MLHLNHSKGVISDHTHQPLVYTDPEREGWCFEINIFYSVKELLVALAITEHVIFAFFEAHLESPRTIRSTTGLGEREINQVIELLRTGWRVGHVVPRACVDSLW